MLGADVTDAEQVDEIGDDEDEHGSNRDPAEDINDIVTYATARGWSVKKGRRAYEINTPLTIDWLVENLERRIGIEGYAWTSGSSMAHGEHAADTASWIELSQDIGVAPAWMIRMWSTGAWAGPRLFLTTLAAYGKDFAGTAVPAVRRRFLGRRRQESRGADVTGACASSLLRCHDLGGPLQAGGVRR